MINLRPKDHFVQVILDAKSDLVAAMSRIARLEAQPRVYTSVGAPTDAREGDVWILEGSGVSVMRSGAWVRVV
jgi:hypothetical protein